MKKSDVIKFFGTQAEVARVLGINRAAVSAWGERVPPLRALQIENLTDGALKADPKLRNPSSKAQP